MSWTVLCYFLLNGSIEICYTESNFKHCVTLDPSMYFIMDSVIILCQRNSFKFYVQDHSSNAQFQHALALMGCNPS